MIAGPTMLDFVIRFGVPAGLFALMLIVGTELVFEDFKRTAERPRAVLLAATGQLVLLPLFVFLVDATLAPSPFIATASLLLALCPGGPISNYYCYLARCNVSLSVSITAVGTICSLFSIPLWLGLLSSASHLELLTLPAHEILLQLFALMIVPMAAGMILVRAFSPFIERHRTALKRTSFGIIFAILIVTIWTVRDQLASLAPDIALSAALFILGAMLLGYLLGYGMRPHERPVLVFESAVRNIGVALIVGRDLFNAQAFAKFVVFLTGYFIIEMVIMLSYSQFVRRQIVLSQLPRTYVREK